MSHRDIWWVKKIVLLYFVPSERLVRNWSPNNSIISEHPIENCPAYYAPNKKIEFVTSFQSYKPVKINKIITKTTEIIEYGFHVDIDKENITTAVFYINTCNGYTLFRDGTKTL